jgi:non-specific serine/threonine protein kinase
MSQQDLCAIIRPDGLLLEWADTTVRYPEASRHFQQDLYRRYYAEPESWLLVLAFSDPALRLSPSLAFWRDLATSFAEQLAHLPDLEERREDAVVELSDDDMQNRLASAPLVTGAEYLNADLITTIWSSLHQAFRRLIATYDGTVEAFIHAYRPNLQLAGRIFFHLVENNKGSAPFAFLATYSTRMGGDGSSRHLPLKYALQEYGSDRDKLLELLSTVYLAAKESDLLPHLL